MKKKMIVLLSIFLFLFCLICFNSFLNNKTENRLKDFYLDMLNGVDISDTNISKISDVFAQDYQKNKFVEDNYLFCILDDVSYFFSVVEDTKDLQKLLETDEFYNADMYFSEKPEKYFDYYKYFNKEGKEKDSRIIEKDNKYYMYQKDLKFDNLGYDTINYGVFKREVSEKELNDLTYSESQAQNNYEFVGSQTKDGKIVFVYFNNETKETIEIQNVLKFGIVFSCEMTGG